MSAHLTDLLRHTVDGEPATDLGAEVDEVFRRAGRLRRRRTRGLLAIGAASVAVIAAAGYLLTTMALPGGPAPSPAPLAGPSTATPSAVPMPSQVADLVLGVLAPVVDRRDMKIFPRPPERGDGWRQYEVVDADDRPRGTIEVGIYQVDEDLCFPVRDAPGRCAKTEWAPRGVEYVRYDDESDPDWQVHQTIARRISDGRTLVVMATGERGVSAAKGKPSLTGAQVEKVATDHAMFDAFGAAEQCGDDCPAFKTPLPED